MRNEGTNKGELRRAVDNAPCSLSVRATTPVLLPVRPTFLLSLGVRVRKEGTRDTGEASAGPKRRNQQNTSLLLAPVPPPRISAPRQTCSSFLYVVRVRRFYFSATCAKVDCASCLLRSLLYAILYRACPAGGMSSMLLPCHCRSSLAIIATGWIGPAPWASEQGSDATLKHYAPTLLLARSAVWVCTVTDLRHVILDKSPLCRNGDAWHERI